MLTKSEDTASCRRMCVRRCGDSIQSAQKESDMHLNIHHPHTPHTASILYQTLTETLDLEKSEDITTSSANLTCHLL